VSPAVNHPFLDLAPLSASRFAAIEDRVARLLGKLGFRLWDDALELRDETGQRRVLVGLAEFQEHLGGELTVTLLAGIGRGVEVHEMDGVLVERSIQWLKERAA